ncbi:hypothetical protein C6A77_19355 [Pseudomonas sp. AFG_SD02_1510_Pfu_092]|uniref:LuxR C-terminal-related transcriptional regulator n=1 Tax=Pseudomonas sp. AFG_SD02_1510_Pfu_092 TaxID=2259497 RepID=UPI000DEEF677|nr:LuxR C-terminal-related transcriptional regulator [Pseudomonas sp. AFG_SD02_1510_Pfu_092]RCL22997.1 hypothetical protein C6A77_19355 [Pseudomonas sp. AFG_SD02_1510_Pfu_092]
MQAEMEIYGEDVIGRPGQALTPKELRVLVGLADGETPSAISQAVGIDTHVMRHFEASIKRKLGAKSHPHMISRGFTLGVLMPRALSLLLAFLCASEHMDDANRNSARRSGRANPESRLARSISGRSASGARGKSESVFTISGPDYAEVARAA